MKNTLVAFAVVLVFLGGVLYLSGQTVVEKNMSTETVLVSGEQEIPLYPGLKWYQTSGYGMDNFQLSGYASVSEHFEGSTENVLKMQTSFRDFYENTLIDLGYVEAPEIAADGPGESIWGYKRGEDYVVLGYAGEQISPAMGSTFECPCSWSFTVFAGKKKSAGTAYTPLENDKSDVVDQPAYLIKAYRSNGKNFIDVDYIEWLHGGDSVKAQVQDGLCVTDKPEDCYDAPNGYKRNKNPEIRKLEVANSALISVNGALFTKKFEIDNSSDFDGYLYKGSEEEYSTYVDDAKNRSIKFAELVDIVSQAYRWELYSESQKAAGFQDPVSFITLSVKDGIVSIIVEPYQE
jgi:hypothetical protein